MAEIPFAALMAVSRELQHLSLEHAFTGGSVVGLLLDQPEMTPVRPTDDIDVIIEVIAQRNYAALEDRLRSIGFENDTRPEAPLCRWSYRELTVDLMPVTGDFLGLNTEWFGYALASAVDRVLPGGRVRVVSPVGFLATKLAAFNDRGEGDYFGSHDLEDFISVIDGRSAIVKEVNSAPAGVRSFIAEGVSAFLHNRSFLESLPGHLPTDSGSQARLPILMDKLQFLARPNG
jgi:hypothetical protein